VPQLLPAAPPPAPPPPAPACAPAAESAATHSALLALLRRSGCAFGELEHAPTRTSAESAAVRGASLSSGAKALLLRAGRPLAHGSPHVLAVMPASRGLDWARARAALGGVARLSLAPLVDVAALTGCLPGAVPPFGSLFAGVRTLVDASLLREPQLNFNSGLKTHSVLGLAIGDYLRIERPEVALICEDEPA
jgi:Ala-tRNA(Pro) deacylase